MSLYPTSLTFSASSAVEAEAASLAAVAGAAAPGEHAVEEISSGPQRSADTRTEAVWLEAFLIVIACTSVTGWPGRPPACAELMAATEPCQIQKKGIASRTLLYHAIFLYNLLCSSSRLTPGSTSHRRQFGVSGTWLLMRKERNDD